MFAFSGMKQRRPGIVKALLVIFALVFMGSAPGGAAPGGSSDLEGIQGRLYLNNTAYYLIDESGSMTIDTVSLPGQQAGFRPLSEGLPIKSSGVMWLRFSIKDSQLLPEAQKVSLLFNLNSSNLGIEASVIDPINPKQPDGVTPRWRIIGQDISDSPTIKLPEPGAEDMTVFVLIKGVPGLWFEPYLERSTIGGTTEIPWMVVMQAALLLLMLICILRGVKENEEWRFWSALVVGLTLVLAIFDNFGVEANDLRLVDMPNMLAPGLLVLLIPHLGRHLMDTKRNKGLDVLMLLLSIPGVFASLLPMVPSMSWTVRLLPFASFLLIPLIIPTLYVISKKQRGGRIFLPIFLFPILGSSVALYGYTTGNLDYNTHAVILGYVLSALTMAVCKAEPLEDVPDFFPLDFFMMESATEPSAPFGNEEGWARNVSDAPRLPASGYSPQQQQTINMIPPQIPQQYKQQQHVVQHPVISHPGMGANQGEMPGYAQQEQFSADPYYANPQPPQWEHLAQARLENSMLSPYEQLMANLRQLQSHNPQAQDAGGDYASNLESAIQLLTQLTQGGGMPQPTGEIFNLSRLIYKINENIRPLAEANGIAMSWFVAPSLPPLFQGNAAALSDVLEFLLRGALEDARGGTIQLGVRPEGSEHDNLVLFSIVNSGAKAEEMQKPAEWFNTAWELANRSNGTVGIEFVPDKGMVFSYNMRLLPAPASKENMDADVNSLDAPHAAPHAAPQAVPQPAQQMQAPQMAQAQQVQQTEQPWQQAPQDFGGSVPQPGPSVTAQGEAPASSSSGQPQQPARNAEPAAPQAQAGVTPVPGKTPAPQPKEAPRNVDAAPSQLKRPDEAAQPQVRQPQQSPAAKTPVPNAAPSVTTSATVRPAQPVEATQKTPPPAAKAATPGITPAMAKKVAEEEARRLEIQNKAKRPEKPAFIAPAPAAGSPLRDVVVIADQAASGRRIISRRLGSLPHRQIEARSGDEIVKAADTNNVGLIIVDADMPEAEVADALTKVNEHEAQAGRPPVPSLCLVAHESQTERMRKVGCTVCQPKSAPRGLFMETVMQLCPHPDADSDLRASDAARPVQGPEIKPAAAKPAAAAPSKPAEAAAPAPKAAEKPKNSASIMDILVAGLDVDGNPLSESEAKKPEPDVLRPETGKPSVSAPAGKTEPVTAAPVTRQVTAKVEPAPPAAGKTPEPIKTTVQVKQTTERVHYATPARRSRPQVHVTHEPQPQNATPAQQPQAAAQVQAQQPAQPQQPQNPPQSQPTPPPSGGLPQPEEILLPMTGIKGEYVDGKMMPMIPGLLILFKESVQNLAKSLEENSYSVMRESAGLIAFQANRFSMRKLEQTAKRLATSAGEATPDEAALQSMSNELINTVMSYQEVLRGMHDDYLHDENE